ncbi:MAG: DUF504 domain-containing protein [Candidatus Lokiarchaeota archaeon]|nr:DUF504 domain-containing protein [Candidatus Lokiarchaeota archaeon]
MAKSDIRELLNKIKWTEKGNYDKYKIQYVHRGAPNDQKSVKFDKIIDITPSFFAYKEEINEVPTYIPFHRIVEIIDIKKDKILWSKS